MSSVAKLVWPCRPLAKVMDEGTIPIGIPCMTEAHVASRNFFFVRVHVQTDALPEQRALQQVGGAACVHLSQLCKHASYLYFSCSTGLRASRRCRLMLMHRLKRVLTSRTVHVMQAVPIPELELGTLLAASPYGRTHRGFYKGQPVAVKVRHSCQRSIRSAAFLRSCSQGRTHGSPPVLQCSLLHGTCAPHASPVVRML